MRLAALGGAILCAGIGGGIGALIKSDEWKEVSLDRLRVSLRPQGDGIGIGASVAF